MVILIKTSLIDLGIYLQYTNITLECADTVNP